MRQWRLLLLLGCLFIVAAVGLCRLQAVLPASTIGQFMEREGIAGAVIARRDGNGIMDVRVLGVSVPGYPAPLSANSLLPVASLSKPITAGVVRALIASGRLSLDSRLIDVVAGLESEAADPRFRDITIQQLLSHTAGLPGAAADPMFHGGVLAGCSSAIASVLDQALAYPPGQHMDYSNVGYCLLARVIEGVAGLSYEESVYEILRPEADTLVLGVPDSFGADLAEIAGVTNERWRDAGAAGGWFATAGALAEMFFNDANDKSITIGRRPGEYYYGLGWRVWPHPEAERVILTHYGYLPGVFSVAVIAPDNGAVVAIFNGSPSDPERAFRLVFDLLRNEMHPVSDWSSLR